MRFLVSPDRGVFCGLNCGEFWYSPEYLQKVLTILVTTNDLTWNKHGELDVSLAGILLGFYTPAKTVEPMDGCLSSYVQELPLSNSLAIHLSYLWTSLAFVIVKCASFTYRSIFGSSILLYIFAIDSEVLEGDSMFT